jgi:PAS domain-containing protein
LWLVRAQRKKLAAETTASYVGTAERLWEQLESLWAKSQADAERLAALLAKLDQAEAEVTLLKRIAPGLVRQLLVSKRQNEDVAWLLDETGLCWIISSPIPNGKRPGANASIVWASKNWFRALGRQPEELHGSGWYDLLHPSDRDKTVRAEAGATYQKVRVVNRYQCADGTYVVCDWRALSYDEETGVAAAYALIVGKEN